MSSAKSKSRNDSSSDHLIPPVLLSVVLRSTQSIATANNNGDKIQPWQTPVSTRNQLVDDSWNSMQQTISTLTKEANKVVLYINAEKCKMITTSVWSDRSDIQAAVSVTKVDNFFYLGSYLSSNGSCEKDVKVRIGKTAAVFGKMRRIWKKDNISLRVKTRLYEAIILSTLLYAADVWPLTATLTERLDAAHHSWQKSMLGIS